MTRTYGHRDGKGKGMRYRIKAANSSARVRTKKNANENMKQLKDGRKQLADLNSNEIVSNPRREWGW